MMASQVNMGNTIVRKSRTSQVFANRETTFFNGCGLVPPVMDTDDDIARRLVAVRQYIAHGISQQEFAKSIGLEKNVYNPFEKGKRPLTIDAAKKIRRRWGVSVDWLLFGDFGLDQRETLQRLGPAPLVRVPDKGAAKPPAKPSARTKRRA